jgi:hypothetical protein
MKEADEMEDYLELLNRKVRSSITASAKDRAAGKTRTAAKLRSLPGPTRVMSRRTRKKLAP